MSWVNYLFLGVNKTDPMTRLAPSTDKEKTERISASTSSYTIESNEDIFRPDTVFESFHYQAKVPMSDRALLMGFLMLWLKRYVVLTLPHEVIVVDVVYLGVLLAHRKFISLSSNGGWDSEWVLSANYEILSGGDSCGCEGQPS